MNNKRRLTPRKRVTSADRRLARARELLAWYGPGTVQHVHATRELERLAQVQDGSGNGKGGSG